MADRRSIRRFLTISACTSVALLAWGGSASASIDVDSFLDNGDGANCTLRDAIDAANQGNAGATGCTDASNQWNEIELDGGTYTITDTTETTEDDNTGGDFDIGPTLTIRGEGPNATTIDADDKDRAFDALGAGSTLTLDSLRIRDGDAVLSQEGGAVQSVPTASLHLSSVTFDSNTSTEGGAVRAQGPLQVLNGSTFVGNTSAADGGAISLNSPGQSLIDQTAFVNNSAAMNGGAIVLFGNAETDISNTTFSGNTASGSAANQGGGAMYLYGTASNNSDLLFVTMAGNSAPSGIGGGVFLFPGRTLTAQTSIFAGNTAAGAASNCGGGGDVETDVNDAYTLESANTCFFTPAPSAHNLINTDPQLSPLADNGGGTLTLAPYVGSPAVDAIPSANCGLPVNDQRDVARPANGNCDIGAVEGSVARPADPPVITPPAVIPPPAETPKKKCKKGKKLKRGKCVKKKKKKKKKKH